MLSINLSKGGNIVWIKAFWILKINLPNAYYFCNLYIYICFLGCENESEVICQKYKYNFFGTFDTLVQTIIYEQNEKEANKYN